MGKLKREEILHIAGLAKLELSAEEIEKYTLQLSGVIDYFSELSNVNTENIEPAHQTTGLENIKRADEIKNDSFLTQDEVLSGTDKTHNGYFKVDAILEGRTDK